MATTLPCLIFRLQSDELKVQTHMTHVLYIQLDVTDLSPRVPLLDSAERAEAVKKNKIDASFCCYNYVITTSKAL